MQQQPAVTVDPLAPSATLYQAISQYDGERRLMDALTAIQQIHDLTAAVLEHEAPRPELMLTTLHWIEWFQTRALLDAPHMPTDGWQTR